MTPLVYVEPGSSPRVRGTPRDHRPFSDFPVDHPRVCGEHALQRRREHHQRGSSPRVRGTHEGLRRSRLRRGIIPACAGNTSSPVSSRRARRDHPRVCGEHYTVEGMYAAIEGSSPRVRGTRYHQYAECRIAGIIPACAGNTAQAVRGRFFARDHPRVCGEHDVHPNDAGNSVGSSPRVRGTRFQLLP